MKTAFAFDWTTAVIADANHRHIPLNCPRSSGFYIVPYEYWRQVSARQTNRADSPHRRALAAAVVCDVVDLSETFAEEFFLVHAIRRAVRRC